MRKKILSLILVAMMVSGLAACGTSGTTSADASQAPTSAEKTPNYTAGTYTATAKGMGEVTVNMTVDGHSIVSVSIDVSNETASIGGAQGDTLTAQIMKSQSAEIDGVSGATVTSTAVKTAAADCLAQAAKEPAQAFNLSPASAAKMLGPTSGKQ
jgi:uncharacterized protein with FMN-binding domain